MNILKCSLLFTKKINQSNFIFYISLPNIYARAVMLESVLQKSYYQSENYAKYYVNPYLRRGKFRNAFARTGKIYSKNILTLFRMGFFGAAIVILYLKQIQKLYESRDSLHFFRQSANFAILGNTDLGSI